MFDKLIEFLSQFWEGTRPWTVILEYERAVLLRLGRYSKTLGPGLHWVIPWVDTTISVSTVANTYHLADQSLITRDGEAVSVSAVITYEIADVRKALLEVEGGTAAVADISFGAIAEWVCNHTLDELREPRNWPRIATVVRKQGKTYGIDVKRVTFSDITRSKTLRLLGQNAR